MAASGPWSGQSDTTENYMLIVSGSVHYAPFLGDWQEFKDQTRKVVVHQPGWTDVMIGPRRGEMQGWCRIDKKNDADTAYDHYANKRGVLVHIFKTSRTSSNFRLLKCNCSPSFPGLPERSHSPNRSGIDAGGVNQYIARTHAGHSTPQYTAPTQTIYSYAVYPQIPAYTTPTFQPHAAPMQSAVPQIPMYSASTSGIPVNLRHGAMLTEARGIFINNLSYNVTPSDLITLVSSVGQPVETKLHRDPRTGAFKGVATAKFATKEEAQYAVTHLNRRQHMGTTINVRLDTEVQVVGQVQPPAIVNGSR
ncbi:hypothetical protein CC78DRAFT_8470 [Lojkania enalia]|uniref:RRM domain-containing protein n=1 Tax=Lojkania enalia TaxID=147567 RepID=A0A9P4TQZ8_9PLEO|nr:hypothetical protein CC78DRAFT_8470 [Didymosphaeria enalia]